MTNKPGLFVTFSAYNRLYPQFNAKKRIVLFATSGGSGFGNTVAELEPSAPDATIVEGAVLVTALHSLKPVIEQGQL